MAETALFDSSRYTYLHQQAVTMNVFEVTPDYNANLLPFQFRERALRRYRLKENYYSKIAKRSAIVYRDSYGI
jgi:hypothetical protein